MTVSGQMQRACLYAKLRPKACCGVKSFVLRKSSWPSTLYSRHTSALRCFSASCLTSLSRLVEGMLVWASAFSLKMLGGKMTGITSAARPAIMGFHYVCGAYSVWEQECQALL